MSVKETLHIGFRCTSGDNLGPRSEYGCVSQGFQNVRATLSVSTPIKHINDKTERMFSQW